MKCKPLLGCWVCVWGLWAHAQPPTTEDVADAACTEAPCPPVSRAAPARLQVGQATRALLQRQASGAEASPSPHALSGEVAQKVYARYVESFTHPIPERAASPMARNAARK